MYPIEQVIPDVKDKLNNHSTVILQAPPGAGKSTVLPVALLNESFLKGKKIIMLEPRRLAARAVASRMSEMLNESPGETIGYRIRFDNLISSKTKLEVVTEGILVRMLQNDPALEEYGLVIFDEFHERSIHADLGLALTRQSQAMLRDELKILVMSATLDTQKLSAVLQAPVISSEGKMYPVSLRYKPENKSKSLADNVAELIEATLKSDEGDMLVFLPGAGEIKTVANKLDHVSALIRPLYGDLTLKEQHDAILPDNAGRRKVVLSTSIAETSLTIEGIKIVIDSGYSRSNKFDPSSGLNKLITTRVTKDTADQRAGRAGRTGPGTCIRMWSELEQQHLSETRKPELEEADLCSLLLDLANWGDIDIKQYEWISLPPQSSINTAKEVLEKTGAIKNDKITDKGKKMSLLPAHPRIAHMLLDADKTEVATAVDLAALLDERDPLINSDTVNIATRIDSLRKLRRKEKVNANINTLQRIDKSCIQWSKMMKCTLSTNQVDEHLCGKLLSYAYPERIGKHISGGRYRLANGRSAMLNEYDELSKEEWISVATMDASKEAGKIYYAAPLDKESVLHLSEKAERVSWNDEKQLIEAMEERRIGPLVVSSRIITSTSEEQRVTVLTGQIKKQGLKFLGDIQKLDELRARINSLAKWNSKERWPDVSEKELTENTEWIRPYLVTVRKRSDIEKLSLDEILKNSLDWEFQQKLDNLAPVSIEVPTGSKIKLEYFEDGRPPVLAVRLQELFGLFDTPLINNGKQKVMIHLLSPGYKPVQVTQDLRSFWTTTYHEVRKELKIRYSKHFWPEDPLKAEAVRGVKRK